MLLEFCHTWCCDHFLQEPVLVFIYLLSVKSFPDILPTHAVSCHFLGSCHWSQEWRDGYLPLLFPLWRCWRPQWGLPSVSSSPGWTNQVTSAIPQQGFPSRSFTMLVALFWMLSNNLMPFLYHGAQNWTHDSRWGHTSAEQSGTIPSFDWLMLQCLMQPSWLPAHSDNSTCHWPRPSGPFLQHCFPASDSLVYKHSQGFPIPGRVSSTCHC